MRPLLALLCCVIALPTTAVTQATPKADRPHVLLILGDDQAWSDYGFTGHDHIRTPNLDALAARSLRFDRGYVTSPLCRPSLASISTGLHPHQHGVVANDVDPKERAKSDRDAVALFRRHPNLQGLLTEAGYLTHQSGKWWEGAATDSGFTHGMTHGDPKRGGRHGDKGLEIGRKGLAPVTEFVDHALAEERPFFLWYAPFLPHTPHNPPAELLEKYRAEGRPENAARYAAMCEWFDATCGELLGHLEARDVLEDTLVVFLADNGWRPLDATADNPDGWWPKFAPRSKGSPFENGIRTPILLAWPERIPPERSPALAVSTDLMPTILRACGVAPPDGLPGIDLLDAEARDAREQVFGAAYSIHNMVPGDPLATLQYRWCITRDWKLLLRSDGVDTTRYRTVHAWDTVQTRLWNLRRDPAALGSGASDLAQRAETVAALSQRIEAWLPSDRDR